MSFVSYAQNCEDVLLWRALKHVRNGFYIDVGANDPVMHSVSKAFYDAGWSGINIEPMPSYQAEFQAQRPRDLNLAVACGAQQGEITLYEVPDMNGWASTERTVADAHRADGHALHEVTVPLRTLDDICAEHVQGPIHFLKIDVEGFEGEVLRGLDLERWRPWILVIEATLPGQRVSAHERWEALVTAHRYQFAWFDGLNRYYVADEQAALSAVLAQQPNVFDDYISHHLAHAWQAKETLAGQLQDALQAAAGAKGRATDAEAARRAMAEQALHDGRAAHQQLAQAVAATSAVQSQLQEAQAELRAALLLQTEQGRQLAAREAQLIVRDGDLARSAHEAEALRQALAEQRTELANRDRALAEQRTELANRDRALAEQRTELANNERALTRHSADLARHSADLARQAAELADSELALAQASQQLVRNEAEAAALQAALHGAQEALQHSEHARHQLGQWAGGMQQRLLQIEGSWWWRTLRSLNALGAAPQTLARHSRDGSLRILRVLARNESTRRLLIPLQRHFPHAAEGVLRRLRPAPPPPPAAAVAVAEAMAQAMPQAALQEPAQAAGASALFAANLASEADSVRSVLSDLVRAIHSPTP